MSSTDKPLKEGQVHVKQNKFGKKWKRCYALLYPDSPFGVARLEFYDWKDGTLSGDKMHIRRATDRKIVRLAECVCVTKAPTETGPKENMAAFTLQTSDKTMLLSAERAVTEEWIQRLSEVAFQNKLNGSRSSQENEPENPDSAPLEMAVNSIYISREDVCEFYVTVQRTEAAERCSLRGAYILRTDSDCLTLKDKNSKEPLYTWPYKLLRRYGRDKVMFSFEAGRQCSSGQGNFTFETSQGHEIFQQVESSIKAQQGPENRLSCPTLDIDCSMEASLIPEPVTPEVQVKGAPVRKEQEEKPLKGRTLPNIPLPKSAPPQHLLDPATHGVKPGSSGTPPRSPVSRSPSQSPAGTIEHLVGVYSEPKDSVKGTKPQFDPLYSDPVDCLAGKGLTGQRSQVNSSGVSPLYADLYEQVSYEVVVGGTSQKLKGHLGSAASAEEHIYDEPEGIAQAAEPPQLYSEVRMEGGAWRTQANDEKLGYEYPYNPKTDDYSVPNPQGQRSQPRNKASGPKPIPAPKPQGKVIPKQLKEQNSDSTSGQTPFPAPNTNNNNNNMEVVYSIVQKPGGVAQQSSTTKPLKPPAMPTMPLPAKPLTLPPKPSPVKALTAPPLPLPAKPQIAPPTLPSKPTSPSFSEPNQSMTMFSEKELSVDTNRLTSIYEDMGVL
ncbi:docking protein 1 [Discoglossus pictus]